MRVVVVDLFCGAGGLTYGLEETGLEVIAGVDLDPACKFPYDENTSASFRQRDIKGLLDDETDSDVENLTQDELKNLYPDDAVKVLVGCAPCQPFSELNNGDANTKHDKWGLLEAVRRVAEAIEPELVAIENVAGLANDEIYTRRFREWFENHDSYNVWDDVIDCSDYLVPQSRTRLIMLASQFGNIELIPPIRTDKDIVTVRRTFDEAGLPKLGPGEIATDADPMHKAAGLRGKNPERMRHTKEGEDWHDWPDRLKLDSHNENNSYTAYGRMWWDKLAPTLTTQFFNWGSGRFGHPDYDENPKKSTDRAISLREGALLQTFPKEYKFVEENEVPTNTKMGRLIGNAVPVRVGNAIGGSIRRHLSKQEIDVDFMDVDQKENNTITSPSYRSLVVPPVIDFSDCHQDEDLTPAVDAVQVH